VSRPDDALKGRTSAPRRPVRRDIPPPTRRQIATFVALATLLAGWLAFLTVMAVRR